MRRTAGNYHWRDDSRILHTDILRRRCDGLSRALDNPWDRVNVLGDDNVGHTGCVNALSWARDGQLLLSGGDDRTVQIWELGACDGVSPSETAYPFSHRSVIHTGHRANIFNAHLLPHSARIATAAGDRQVRIHDLGDVGRHVEDSASHKARRTHIVRCHSGRVKRIVTEDSPDVFMSVSEDGTVRQHDLRTAHRCGESCPAPLVEMNHELSTLAMSPLSPYQFVVAGEMSYAYLIDRRHISDDRVERWGMCHTGLTTAVKRFGRLNNPRTDVYGEHITGARMSSENGHELLLSYSGDGVYLYSTLDDPEESRSLSELPKEGSATSSSLTNYIEETETEEPEIEEETEYEMADDGLPGLPTVYPQRKFVGARNVETVKDVNFLGPRDEYVTSGSDDGNYFVWRKATGVLEAIYEGDGAVVNVVEGHPHLPLVATSGIDTTVKIFAPVQGTQSPFNRTHNRESIVQENSRSRTLRTLSRLDIASLFGGAAMMAANDSEGGGNLLRANPECVPQ